MQARYPERIVCLTEETTETLNLFGEQDRIVGISGFTVRPPEARRDNDELHEIKSVNILQPGPAALTDGLGELAKIMSVVASC